MIIDNKYNHYTSYSDLMQWAERNKAECIECIEGCLLDHLVFRLPDIGYMFCYETYINCWTSAYTLKWANDNAPELSKLWAEWYELEKEMELICND